MPASTRKLSPNIYDKTQADLERAAPEIPVSLDAPPASLQAQQERAAPDVPQAAQKFSVTLMIDPDTAMDEVNVHLAMTERDLERLIAGEMTFVRLPKRYSKHPSGYDSGETIYINYQDITQIRISGWLYPSQD